MAGWQTGSQRFRKKVVRERPDLKVMGGRHGYELACGHVVFRERRAFGGACYCEVCKAEAGKSGA